MKLTNKYRPKADRGLLRSFVRDAWQAYHDKEFPDDVQCVIGEQLATLLEQRFLPEDMAVLARYGLASAPENASVSIYHPERQRWDVYANVKLPRLVLCLQGRAHFFVGGSSSGRGDHLSDEFVPYFERIRVARDDYTYESNFSPHRVDGSYPTWEQIAAQLPVAGVWIRERLA